MSATLIVRHPVADYAKWRAVFDSVGALQSQHGVTGSQVLRQPDDANDVTVIHTFAAVEHAQGFVADPALKDAMQRAGVSGPPCIEIFVGA